MRKFFITVLSFAVTAGSLLALVLSVGAAWIGPGF
jgi:hypothetical protein